MLEDSSGSLNVCCDDFEDVLGNILNDNALVAVDDVGVVNNDDAIDDEDDTVDDDKDVDVDVGKLVLSSGEASLYATHRNQNRLTSSCPSISACIMAFAAHGKLDNFGTRRE